MATPVTLDRTDKWYVGSGDGLVWAPPFPIWHLTPGYWDDAHLLQYPVGPLFTISFIVPGGIALPCRARSTLWTPASFILDYQLARGIRAREVRSAPGDRVLASEWTLENRSRMPATLDILCWTAVDGESVADDGVRRADDGLLIRRTLRDRKAQTQDVAIRYRFSPGPTRHDACRSEHSAPHPEFRLTPFYDRWADDGRLRNQIRLGGIDRRGLVYAAIGRRVRIGAGRSVRFAATAAVDPVSSAPRSPVRSRLTPARTASQAWARHLRETADFRSSDPWFDRYWRYRSYGLRLNRVPAGLGEYRHDTVCEGIGYFHQPISYSTMCHLRELRWRHDPAWARGVAHTFLDRLAPDGAMPGRVYLNHLVQPDFYHADWGGALDDLLSSHPDERWARSMVPALSRYAEWMNTTRDREGSGMIDVVDQFETGQEYMSRYEAVDPDADRYGWENRIRLKGIDVTVYAWRLFRFLAQWAVTAGDRARWASWSRDTGRAIRDVMWDPGTGMFSDVNPATGQRTRVKAAVCFYPYLTELVDERHLEGMEVHLFNPREFWTPFPVPSSSVDDPRFNPDAEWKGKRHVCPWNGRVWPMTNSHLVDALARVVRTHRPEWAPQLMHLLRQFVRMMSFDGDATRPNCFEHYHPYSGRGSLYRGIDDYQHSWVNDLLARHVAGVLPRGDAGLVVDPLPFGGTTEFTGAMIAGHRVDVRIRDGGFTLRIDGRRAGQSRVGRALEIPW